MKNFVKNILLASTISAISTAPLYATTIQNPTGMVPSGKGWGVPSTNYVAPKVKGANGIDFHGGEVMGTTCNNTPNIYLIWYGSYTNQKRGIIDAWASTIGGSSYFNINSTYTDASGNHVQNKVNFKGEVFDNYSLGKTLNDGSIVQIVSNQISGGKLPLDSNGVYFVLTAPDVKESTGFCSAYCGWHMAGVYQNRAYIRVVFVGDASTQCPGGCMTQSKASPNNNPPGDAMVSIVAHELEESVTDPLGNAWYDANGNENADKCSWNYGTTKPVGNGSVYNMQIGNLKYLIQQNWVNANGGYCSQGI